MIIIVCEIVIITHMITNYNFFARLSLGRHIFLQ